MIITIRRQKVEMTDKTLLFVFFLVKNAKILFAKILHFEIINQLYFLVITFHFQGVAH